MPNTNFLTRTRLAIWDEIKRDPEIAAAVGNGQMFEFDSGLRKRLELTSVICPYVAITPSDADLSPKGTNVHKRWIYTLALEIGVYGQDVAPAEELTALIMERLIEPRESYFGVHDTGFVGLVFGRHRWEMLPGKDAADLYWTCSMPVGLEFFRSYPTRGG